MMVASLEDALASFRGIESNEDAIPVLGDSVAMRVLAAWMHVDNAWERPEAPMPPARAGGMASLWDWVVAGWDLEAVTQRVSRAAGVPVDVAHQKIEMLVGNRLIYPDGSMAKGARSALNVDIARKLGIKQQLPKPPTPAPPKNEDQGN